VSASSNCAHNTGALLLAQADRYGHRPAIVVDEQETSYRELADRSTDLARGLIAAGVLPGDRVALLLPNSADYAACFFAIGLVGAISVNVNARYRRHELQYLIGHAQPTVLITTDEIEEHVDFIALITETLPELAAQPDPWTLQLTTAPSLRCIVLLGRGGRPPAVDVEDFVGAGAALSDEPLPARPGSADETALILYTSGTTAAPKGCEIRHRALVANWFRWGELIALQPGEAVWAPCPMFHIAGIGPLVGMVAAGGVLLTSPHFDPDRTVTQLLRHRPTHLFPGFPALTLGVLRSPGYRRQDFGFLRTVHNVAPPETQRVIEGLLPDNAVLTSNFGMTEGAGPITYTPPDEPAEVRLASTGPAFPNYQVRIADPVTDLPLEPSEPGEIQFRSETAFHAYYRNPEATRATILPGGWIKTGDLGVLDRAGRLNYLGRLKEILKVGGENVTPLEIEALLTTHPAVNLAQLVGRDDERLGEVPVAFVELLPGGAVTEAELIEFVAGQVASFKVPRAVQFVTEWPMSATKILKSVLRDCANQPAANGEAGGGAQR
jgi:acyl-CoA synthetase (AMP-forming)/AMP-acid ligase II